MEVTRLFDIFPWQKEKYPQNDAIAGKYDGRWKKWSTDDVIKQSDSLAAGMLNAGIQKGDAIAVMGDNSPEWALCDQAILKMGGMTIPIYPTGSPEYVKFVLLHSATKIIFLQNEEHYEKVNALRAELPDLKEIYTFEKVAGAKEYHALKDDVTPELATRLKEIQDGIHPDDLATIIYTSGTTGDPKGVMLSHHNIVSNVLNSRERLPVGNEHTGLSFLPLSHIFERMINYMYFYFGISVYYSTIDEIGDNLKAIRPHVFTAVPRLLEKVFDKVQAGGLANKGFKLKAFKWASKLALQWEPDGQNGFWYNTRLKIADKLVFSKIRNKAGLNRVMACASGSAALQPRLARFFNAIGVPLVEGYGLTETSPVISVGGFEPGMLKMGTVGKVIEGGEVMIASDGEILYKGPNVMLGYYKRDDLTAEAIDDKGWFHTGDIGELDKQGFLRITDRKKEMFKTSGGKYIAPQQIENKFKASPFIEQIVVVGEYRKFAGALIVPNFEHLEEWMKSSGISYKAGDRAAIVAMSEVQNKFQSEVDVMNQGFARYETIKKFELLTDEFSIEGGEMTPKLSIKRKVVDQKYATQIEKIYAEE